jgi:hypothetical protein
MLVSEEAPFGLGPLRIFCLGGVADGACVRYETPPRALANEVPHRGLTMTVREMQVERITSLFSKAWRRRASRQGPRKTWPTH